MARIDLSNLDLTYQVRRRHRESLKDYVLQRVQREPESRLMKIPALREINLEVREGDRVAVLGHNGAGKSTLLKVIAGVYPPTRGTCVTSGRISSLFDLTLGFEPDATGWENISLRCYLEGDNPRGVRGKADSIAAFSGLGDFLDMPVRYYSSGMVVRLAFSIATATEPEILLMDEVFAAGDAWFQEQARRRLEEMMARARIILYSSHDLDALRDLCNRAIWLEQGRIHHSGTCDEVISAYVASIQTGARQAA